DLSKLIVTLFRDLMKLSEADFSLFPEQTRLNLKEQSAIGIVKNLMVEKDQLIDSLLNEQEVLKSHIAMELHDDVLGDLLFVKRSILAEEQADKEDTARLIDSIASRLRSACADLWPRNMDEWGLSMMLQDLTQRCGRRSGIECTFLNERSQFPSLPD